MTWVQYPVSESFIFLICFIMSSCYECVIGIVNICQPSSMLCVKVMYTAMVITQENWYKTLRTMLFIWKCCRLLVQLGTNIEDYFALCWYLVVILKTAFYTFVFWLKRNLYVRQYFKQAIASQLQLFYCEGNLNLELHIALRQK